jgi:serine/threonine protein kinase
MSDMMITPRIRLVRPVQDVRAGRLWVAEHQGLATHVEVTFASAPTDSGAAEEAESFRLQAGVTAHINEPHVVRIFEHGDVKGVPFIITELLEGRSLRQRLMHGPASIGEAQAVVSQACDALAKAHALGIPHGNLRLDCLFSTDVGGEPFLKIAGFGAPPPAEGPSAYSSPEQLLRGTGVDAASDLWALAVSLYELLTTTLPFEAATFAGVTVAICNGQFALPSHYRADLPASVDQWFARALAADEGQRFGNAAAFAQAFMQALSVEAATPQAPAVAPALTSTLNLEAPSGEAPSAPLSDVFPDDADEGEIPSDDSLEMDDGEEDEKTVKWDVPDDWAARGAALGRLHGVKAPAIAALANTLPPPARVNTLPPLALEPSAYLESPYVASVASALAVPQASGPGSVRLLQRPGQALSRVTLPRLNVPRLTLPRLTLPRLPAAGLASVRLPQLVSSFSAEKTWLAAAAFAAGVAATWFAYDPDTSDGDLSAEAAGAADDVTNIRTVSVDDLPRVAGEEAELPTILRTSQLPRAEEAEDGVVPRPLARPVLASAPPRAHTVQRVQALSPAVSAGAPPRTPPRAAPKAVVSKAEAPRAAVAKADAPKEDARGNCSPPYSLDVQGIRRLKPECLTGSGAGPYGAVMNTSVAAKSAGGAAAPAKAAAPARAAAASPAAASGKQASTGTSCTPPYYFDGNIKRLKLECL